MLNQAKRFSRITDRLQLSMLLALPMVIHPIAAVLDPSFKLLDQGFAVSPHGENCLKQNVFWSSTKWTIWTHTPLNKSSVVSVICFIVELLIFEDYFITTTATTLLSMKQQQPWIQPELDAFFWSRTRFSYYWFILKKLCQESVHGPNRTRLLPLRGVQILEQTYSATWFFSVSTKISCELMFLSRSFEQQRSSFLGPIVIRRYLNVLSDWLSSVGCKPFEWNKNHSYLLFRICSLVVPADQDLD